MSLRTFIDQRGNEVQVSFPPQRIISLVPSQTELLSDLGLNERVIAITKFCIHPASWRKSKAIVGGTKDFRFEVIQSLQPDLIIGNKEENYQDGIDKLQSLYPVWMSDIVTLENAFQMIHKIGELTNTSERAAEIKSRIEQSFFTIEKLSPLRTLYLIWRNPWMGAASGTFIHEMLAAAGLVNVLKDFTRYPELAADDIHELNPEVILLSSEPYPFQEKHIREIQSICPQARILLVDGEMFSWYGSRLIKFPEYLKSITPGLS